MIFICKSGVVGRLDLISDALANHISFVVLACHSLVNFIGSVSSSSHFSLLPNAKVLLVSEIL